MSSFATDQRVLKGRFRLVRQLGEGGMGVIWEAQELATGRSCAIKFIKDEAKTPMMEKRFLREAEALRAIVHPNIVTVDEVATTDDGTPAMIMELLRGESLAARIDQRGPLTVGQTCAILARVVDAVRAAHAAGVLHRDLKPDNVFIAVAPSGRVSIRVVDFGIAKLHVGVETLTVTGSIVGTPLYMSPEQASGEKDLDARTDVWSLAIIAFECLTRDLPVSGDNYGQILSRLIRLDVRKLAELGAHFPADLVQAIDGALVPRDRRDARFDTLAAAFARYADATIDPPAPRADVSSTFVAANTTTGDAPTMARGGEKRGIGTVLAVLAVLVVLSGVGFVGIRALRRTSTAASATVTAADSAAPSASAAEADPPSDPLPPVVRLPETATKPTAVTPAKPPATVARPSSPATTAGSTAHVAPPASSSGPKKLSGGVAGEVPF